MSVEWLKWAWDQKLDDPGAKFVLVSIANWANPIRKHDLHLLRWVPAELKMHAGNLGWAWPSQEELAERCDMGERTVRRHLSTLEERDLILTIERRRPDGRKTTPMYLLITSPANFDTTSPANLAATYIDETQGLIHKGGVIPTPPLHSEKTPLPPFRIFDALGPRDWLAVDAAAVCRDGVKLSRKYLAEQYDAWLADKKIVPNNALNHFLDFIARHKERNSA